MNNFKYTGERFADIQMLRYRLNGFENLTSRQRIYIYYLAEATLWGRDITFDQFGKYNFRIRKVLEDIYVNLRDKFVGMAEGDECRVQFDALVEYMKRVWFSNGIYHHYGCDKFVPGFSEEFFRKCADEVNVGKSTIDEICPVMFREDVLPKRVNKAEGVDVVATSACNYYENVSQKDVEDYYAGIASRYEGEDKDCLPSFGLNSTLRKQEDGTIVEDVWRVGGKYGETIEKIIGCLEKALRYAENDQQKRVIEILMEYYRTGDLKTFDEYSIEWIKETEGVVDFINGFIEVYGDPLGIKASWEGIVEYKDIEACERTRKICSNAQWFEDNSPVASQFKKKKVVGVTANVICSAMLGGDEYPSTAIGINLPNADWIRAQYGSKSVTISNLTSAYDEASKGSGFLDEFAVDEETKQMVRTFGHKCDDLHTDLHECLGHGSGQLLPGVDANALKNYSSTIEEARADLFGLYYIADEKLVELGLLDSPEAYKSQYYTYLMNGMLTQCVRIKLGDDIEEAHMRNRAIVANWVRDHAPEGVVELVRRDSKTYLRINDYAALRGLFAQLLAEVQRIKSEGDFEAARELVERYGVKLDRQLHEEILSRYQKLDIAPYKGFLNPKLELVTGEDGAPADVSVSYDEELDEQMLRYSRDYSLFELTKTPEEKVREIKRTFRLYMNGVTAQSINEKGVDYHLNWGVSLSHLMNMSNEYGKDYELAILLWKENIRECKLLATMIMPKERFASDIAMLWIEQLPSQEVAEHLCNNLLQHVGYASDMAFQMLAERNALPKMCGYLILGRLFMRGMIPNDRDINEYIDQVLSVLNDKSDTADLSLRHAAYNSLVRFSGLDDEFELIADRAYFKNN